MKCSICGAQLAEVDRFEISAGDYDQHARDTLGRPLTAYEHQRLGKLDMVGTWRQLECPNSPSHTGFLIERVWDAPRPAPPAE